MMETRSGFSTNPSTQEVFTIVTPTPPLTRIIALPARFMILTGMNNGILSVYVETIFEIAENQGEDRST